MHKIFSLFTFKRQQKITPEHKMTLSDLFTKSSNKEKEDLFKKVIIESNKDQREIFYKEPKESHAGH